MAHRQEVVAIRQIPPLHCQHLWHWIEPGIDKILKRCPDDFEARDVYASLRNPGAPCGSSAFLIFRDWEFQGFLILEVGVDPFKGRRTLCVWLMHFRGAEEVQDAIYEHLDRLKVNAGCCRIHMKSPRLGWMKKAKGFRLKLITWERS